MPDGSHATITTRSRKRRARKLPPGVANPVDVHVGARIRQRRTLLGLSQEKLGDAVGLTFQQIQKYEKGANRVGASRLYQFSRILDVPIDYFFEDMPAGLGTVKGQVAKGKAEQEAGTAGGPTGKQQDPLARPETLKLVRAYYRIPDPKARKRLFELVKSLAE